METLVFIESMMTELKKRLSTVNKMLLECPEGRVIRTNNHGKPVLMHITGKGSRRVRRIITNDIDLQIALARRGIMERERQVIKASLGILRSAADGLSKIGDLDRKQIITGDYGWLTEEMVEQVFNRGTLKSWAEEPYERSKYYASERNMITSRGLAVRTKSELMIAEMLYRYDIPFRYEPVIHVNEKLVLNPDFMILCPDGTIIVWEHEGLVNNASYIEWQRKKAEYYAMLGFVPWKNYIVTYDTLDGNIDMRIIEAEIRNKILAGHGWYASA